MEPPRPQNALALAGLSALQGPPPEAARLLPESDGILSLHFNPIRYLSAIATRMCINTTSNDARIDAWRDYENYDHA